MKEQGIYLLIHYMAQRNIHSYFILRNANYNYAQYSVLKKYLFTYSLYSIETFVQILF